MSTITPREYELKTGEKALIRSALPEDALSLSELCVLAANEDEIGFSAIRTTEERAREWVQKATEKLGRALLVAEVDDLLIGLIDFGSGDQKWTAHRGYFWMFVRREWRDRGAGTALLQTLLDWVETHPQIEKVGLFVFSTNTSAIKLYRKFGFAEEGRWHKSIKVASGKYIDEILMYKFVKEPKI